MIKIEIMIKEKEKGVDDLQVVVNAKGKNMTDFEFAFSKKLSESLNKILSKMAEELNK